MPPLLGILRLSHQSLESLAYSILCVLARAPMYSHSMLKLSDTRTFERYLVVSALVADLTKGAMSKVTDRLAVYDEDL